MFTIKMGTLDDGYVVVINNESVGEPMDKKEAQMVCYWLRTAIEGIKDAKIREMDKGLTTAFNRIKALNVEKEALTCELESHSTDKDI